METTLAALAAAALTAVSLPSPRWQRWLLGLLTLLVRLVLLAAALVGAVIALTGASGANAAWPAWAPAALAGVALPFLALMDFAKRVASHTALVERLLGDLRRELDSPTIGSRLWEEVRSEAAAEAALPVGRRARIRDLIG